VSRTADPDLVRTRRRRGPQLVGGVLAVVALSLVWLPLFGDQAVMVLVGRDVFDGRHLYTGILDAKQPGMHLWYGAIDAVFGPAQPIAQLFSVVAVLGTAWLITGLLVRRLETPWVRDWAPVLVAAGMLLTLDEIHLGQAELVVCLPAVAALALVADRRDTGAGPTVRRALLAGGCLGVVAVFKLLLVAVPGAAVLVYVLAAARVGRLRTLAALAAGALAAPAAVVAWLGLSGDLPAALFAWFVYPAQVLEQGDVRSLDTLVTAVRRFGLLFAGVGLLALSRVPTVVRRRDPLDIALLAWCVMGVATYAIQVWWHYYLIVLIPGLVALAVRQLDDIARRGGPARRIGLPVAAVLTVPMVLYGLYGAGLVVLDGGGLTAQSRDRIAERVGGYDGIRRELAAAGLAPTDTLYVLGDARYQLLADRPYALGTNGWSAEFIPAQRWELIAVELRASPPDLVLVDETSADAMRRRGAGAHDVLTQRYDVVRHGPAGTWYRAREDASRR